jgi:hypothetical membrane protein
MSLDGFAARLSLASASMFLMLLAILHALEPEFDPSWRFVSEYENGPYGWVMRLGFLSLALSSLTTATALRPQVATKSGKVGLALLLAAAAALLVTAIFAPDPIISSPDDTTSHGNVHSLASTLAGAMFAAASLLVTGTLARNSAWASARSLLGWTAHLTWITLLLMYATLLIMLPQNGGKFGPNVWIGWPTRFVVIAIAAWDIAVAWHAINLRGQKHSPQHVS